jgi:hypothetical protein
MLKKANLLALLLISLITGCAQWYISQPPLESQKYGWERCYIISFHGYSLILSLGSCSDGEILAIDCQKTTSNISYRLYVTIDGERVSEINFFKYVNNQLIGNLPQEKQQLWQECFIKTLTDQPIFYKLPQDIQPLVRLAIEAANNKYKVRYYFP